MSKWVIEKVELIKKTYVVESYGAPAAILAANAQAPTKVEILGEVTFDVTAINEYEYDKDWKDLERPNRSLDFLDPDIGPDQLKDGLPDQRELFELEPELTDIGRD